MSFDIFLQCFENGEPKYFERSLFKEVFERHATSLDAALTRVVYADGGAQIFGTEEGESLEGLTFNHAGGDTFFAAVLELAARTGSVLYWPGEPPCIAAADPGVVEHLPADMVEQLGPVCIVRTGDQLRDFILEGILPER